MDPANLEGSMWTIGRPPNTKEESMEKERTIRFNDVVKNGEPSKARE